MNKTKDIDEKVSYRPEYHIAPVKGWMNDPNGLVFFKGYYHVFFQYYPHKPEWGPMHWGHKRSKDLIHWEELPVALAPGNVEDEDGVFSGSAIVKDEKLWLVYTGHHYYDKKDKNKFWQNQNLAYSEYGISFRKYEYNPIISGPPMDSTHHFRDPKIWRHDDKFYIVLGNQTQNLNGRALRYSSDDMFHWRLDGTLAQSRCTKIEGNMWECPDFFAINNKFILLCSPMGIENQEHKFKNLFQTGYFVGKYNYKNNVFRDSSDFLELDSGHDFYAAQTMLAPDGRRILFAWASMWESEFKEQREGWAGMMCLPRNLIEKNNHLYMQPISEMNNLRTKLLNRGKLVSGTILSRNLSAAEVSFTIKKSLSFTIILNDNRQHRILTLHYNNEKNVFTLSHVDHKDDDRYVKINSSDYLKLDFFIDKSSVEIFIQNGEAVFTERYYASPLGISILANHKINGEFVTYALGM